MQVKVKKLSENAVVPRYGSDFAAGADLVATSIKETDLFISYGTGLAFELPPGHVGLLFPRSSVSKTPLSLCNAVGVLDEDFKGEVTFRFRRTSEANNEIYTVGDRIGQILVLPIQKMDFTVVEELSETKRGTGSYGSTGK